jgi:GAF domain-containing protein
MTISFDEDKLVAAARAGDFRSVLEPQAQLTEAIRTNEALLQGEPREAFGKLTEIAARLLGAGRVGIWALDDDLTKLTCVDLYHASEARHGAGTIISRAEAPTYFKLVFEGNVVAVNDALSDERTTELARSYLPAFGVGALLDCPILIERRVAGVLRAEHVGPVRRWEGWERLLGSSLAACAAVAVEVARSSAGARWRRLAG